MHHDTGHNFAHDHQTRLRSKSNECFRLAMTSAFESKEMMDQFNQYFLYLGDIKSLT